MRAGRPLLIREDGVLDIDALHAQVNARLASADAALAAHFPGARSGRQPVHTAYVPADRFAATTVQQWGQAAVHAVDEHAELFAELVGDDALVTLVRAKLGREPVEDVRIDFEDGYGTPGDDVEDADVERAASELADAVRSPAAPAFYGIRIKSLEAPTRARSLRTLVRFVGRLTSAEVPLDRFAVTLPKVTSVEQVEAMVFVCEQVESGHGLPRSSLRFEIQVETPQSILGPDGTALVARMVTTAAGRCTGLHFGTYDYTAYCGIAAEYQSLAHPAADHAKLVMQAAAAGTGVRLSDGSTNVLPVGDVAAVRAGWRVHLDLVRRSLERGYYQGWDLHPTQLPTRYAATYAFYRDSLEAAADRLRRYLSRAGGSVADEPATARALADFLLRALECGAAAPDEVAARAGVDDVDLRALARPAR
jgi:citrate lyase beta subunit